MYELYITRRNPPIHSGCRLLAKAARSPSHAADNRHLAWDRVAFGYRAWTGTPLEPPILASVASSVLSTLFAANVNLSFFGSYGRYEGCSHPPVCRPLLDGWVNWSGLATLLRAADRSLEIGAGRLLKNTILWTI